MRPFWRRPLCVALGLVLWFSCAVHAGGLSILPTRIDLGAGRGVQSVLITNTSAHAVTVETQVMVWPEDAPGQQANDIVVTPAVLTLPPNQRMRVRIGLLRPVGGDIERAYRLYITELMAPASLQGAGIGVRLRIGIPLFVAPPQPQAQPLQWSAYREANAWFLKVRNEGNVHALATKPVLLSADGPSAIPLPSSYVMANSSLTVAITGSVTSGTRVRWLDGDTERESALALP